jgi:hypothetical protein
MIDSVRTNQKSFRPSQLDSKKGTKKNTAIMPTTPTASRAISPIPKAIFSAGFLSLHSFSVPILPSPSFSTPSSFYSPTELPTSIAPDLSPIITNSPSLIQQLALQSDTYAIIFITILLSLVIGMWISKKSTTNP